MWWDEETIDATVNRAFVLAQLEEDEKPKLDEPLRFGGGLTDDTYLEWIEQKAKRLFLILVDLEVPDQIFGVIDDSWDDDDLPIPLEAVDRLRLTRERDEEFEKMFYERQFVYLLRTIEKGEHLVYADEEVVPLDIVEKKPVTGLAHHVFEKVCLPRRPDDVLLRKQIPLGDEPGQTPKEAYAIAVQQMRTSVHSHVVSLWASYVHREVGYVLLSPVNEGTLKSLIANFPPSVKTLQKQERRVMFLQWLHCLADALAFIHSRGVAHGSLKPSNIGLSNDNQLFISSPEHFDDKGYQRGFDKEAYDFAAPERDRPTSSSTRAIPARSHTAPIHGLAAVRRGSLSTVTPFSDTSSIHTNSTSSNNSSSSNYQRADPMPSDVFSLACIYLELLTQLLKKTSRNFTSHRSAKNKLAGRGGGLPDSSYHKNLGQVESWMQMLGKDAGKKDDPLFRGVQPILKLIENMLNPDPNFRPSALEVRNRLGAILTERSGITDLCCCAEAPRWDVTHGIGVGIAKISMSAGSPRSETPSYLPLSPTFALGHRRNTSGTETISTISTIRPGDDTSSLATKRHSGGRVSIGIARSITGDGKEIKERRYASGGGRTAKPRPKPAKTKQWQGQGPVYAVQNSTLDSDRKEIEGEAMADFDVGSLWELRLHDYENGGEVRKVGWENF